MRNISDAQELAGEVAEVSELLRELGRRRPLRDPIALAVEEMQFTPAQVHTLLWLGADGALTMGDLARRVGITEKTITGVVDRLEHAHYVSRERDESDRRVVRVKLARKGVQSHNKLNAYLRKKFAVVLGLLDPGDREALKRILKKLLSRIPQLEQEDP